jgi:hypothetical protein
MNAVLRINFDQEVYVIRHDFHAEDLCMTCITDILDKLFKTRINAVDQHGTAVFRTPDHVVCARVNDVVV